MLQSICVKLWDNMSIIYMSFNEYDSISFHLIKSVCYYSSIFRHLLRLGYESFWESW